VHDDGSPTRAHPAPHRPSEVLRPTHPRVPGQHEAGLGSEPSGRQLVAALAPAGGKDGASGPGPHPETESVDSTAAPVARLERALAHGRAPYIVNSDQVPPDESRAANRGRHSGGDLLTVRGRHKRVKPVVQDCGHPRDCPADTPSIPEKCHERVAARRRPLLRSRLVPCLSFRQRSPARHHQFHPLSPSPACTGHCDA
jgi:hypothetical protein